MDDQLPARAAVDPRPEGGGHRHHSAHRRRSKVLTKLLSRKSILGALGAVLTAAVATIVSAIVMGWFTGHPVTAVPTSSIFLEPWTLTGRLSVDLHIASRVTGYCWEESIAAPRLDAYRCVDRRHILDPCFGVGSSSQIVGGNSFSHVVCANPSPESVTVLKISKPLPVFSAPASLSNPWLLILADGERCYFDTGSTASAGGLRFNYACRHGDLFGSVDKANRIWTIFQQHAGSADMTQVQIVKAYY